MDARLADGSRVHKIIPPSAIDGAAITIRKFQSRLTYKDLIKFGSMTQETADFLRIGVRLIGILLLVVEPDLVKHLL